MFSSDLSYLCAQKEVRMKSTWCLLAGLGLLSQTLQAETTEVQKEKKGKFEPIMTAFTNFHSGFGSTNDDRGFELERCYLGFKYSLPGNLQLRGVLDVGSFPKEEDSQRSAFIKYAEVAWKYKGLKINGGMISTTMFKVQEYFWDKRYLMKSFQDEYSFGSSADLGISLAYQFSDQLSADFIFVNGEGYKKLQINDGLQYGLGVTYNPVKELTLRVYGDINEGGKDQGKTSNDLAFFAGYKNKHFSLAAEYNHMFNFKHTDGHELYGYSVYGSYYLNKKIEFFGRYDNLISNKDWNLEKDGQLGLVGVQFKLGKYVILAPNFRCWVSADDAKSTAFSGYLNCSFVL